MTTVNKTQTFVIETWINCKRDTVRIYVGSDGNYYGKRYGLPMESMEPLYVAQLTWLENNRNGIKTPVPQS